VELTTVPPVIKVVAMGHSSGGSAGIRGAVSTGAVLMGAFHGAVLISAFHGAVLISAFHGAVISV
jgi:hypothetical protein